MLSFIFIITIATIIFVSYNYYSNKTQDLQKITNRIYTLETKFSNNTKNFQSFLLHGYKNPLFYKTKAEKNIDIYLSNVSKQKENLDVVISELKEKDIDLNSNITSKLKNSFERLDTLSTQIKDKKFKLGFKDFGLIGKMRRVVHNIESSKIIPSSQILQLRRFEKDFLLRSEKTYITNFNNLILEISSKPSTKTKALKALNQYKTLFNNVTTLYIEIGNNNNKGIYEEIITLNKSISNNINVIKTTALNAITSKNADIKKYVKNAFILTIIFIASLIFYLSKILTRDLKKLQISMHKFIKSGFKEFDINRHEDKSKILEIDFLYRAYRLLKENLLENIEGLKLTIEELERTTAYKSSFLANMSHEIRTPLNGIVGIINMLNQTNLDKEQVKLLDIANYSSSHLLGLINLILDYSKITAGKMELEDRAINIDNDLKKLSKIFQFQASEKGIDLFYSYKKADNTANLVYGDTIRINQIIINLLNNAIKFTHQGWVKLEVKHEPFDDNYDSLYFSIEDTGIGINKEKSKKIFQAFEQVDLSTTRKYGGTGLGLTISYELAALMGSELKFKPANNGGTIFHFHLKLKKVPITLNTISNNIPSNEFSILQKTEKVLIVDDNKMNQKVLGLMLKKFDLSIDYASNGVEAIELYNANPYDIIFMDIQMPIMDGLEATKLIKESYKFKMHAIPIIAVSASAYTDDRKKANKAGIDDFISKPIEIKELHNLLIKYSFKNDYDIYIL